MKNNFFIKLLGSGFYTGYIPFAPGTFGSLAALLIYWFIPGFELPYVIIPLIVIFFLIGIKAGDRFEITYGKKDPSEATIDEVVGMWISLLFVPKVLNYVILSFVIWRIFDIIKPSPARNAEKLKGGLGIMLDDVIAAAYSCILVHLIIFLFVH
ncbi:MAG TPA: phosphatidylglycerophosphatase A [Ignavibacteriales bacterium]|nr:phosphatidylglycerophosphatase A [Ignavibacteriales bacterium]